jgi:hypothetical protein
MTDQKIGIRVMLILIFAVFSSTVLTSKISAFNYDTILEKSFDASPGQDLKIEAEGGDVTIETWAKNEVYVHITGNSKAEDDIEFEVVEKSYGIYVKAEKEGSWFGSWGGIEYKIAVKIPETYNADVATSGGDIQLEGMNGSAEMKTSGGDVTIENTAGDFVLKTSGGDIKAKKHDGGLDISTSGGDIIAEEIKGDINAGTSGGNIKLEAADAKIDARTSGGDLTVKSEGENKGINLSTTGGDIDLILDPDVAADLDLKTTGGDIDIDMQTSRVMKVSSSKFLGEINGGGPEIKCHTTGGDITAKSR